jgi:Lar family restriction alleviation protein
MGEGMKRAFAAAKATRTTIRQNTWPDDALVEQLAEVCAAKVVDWFNGPPEHGEELDLTDTIRAVLNSSPLLGKCLEALEAYRAGKPEAWVMADAILTDQKGAAEMTELKRCPFCKSANVKAQSETEEWNISQVRCHDCGAIGPWVDIDEYSGGMVAEAEAKASQLWNVRHD